MHPAVPSAPRCPDVTAPGSLGECWLTGDVTLGFPGVGGMMRHRSAEYARIPQQPTALQAGGDPRLDELAQALGKRGFAIQRVADMDGWLAHHAAFVARAAAALYRCATDPGRVAADRQTLKLMCAAVTQAFAALRRMGMTGLPRNLAVLHNPLLERWPSATGHGPFARPWASSASPLTPGHAEAEMRALGDQVTNR
jgi:hypothetical protein